MNYKSSNEVNDNFNNIERVNMANDLSKMVERREDTIRGMQAELKEAEDKIQVLKEQLNLAKKHKPISYIDLSLLPSDYYGTTNKEKIKKCKLEVTKGFPIFYIQN